MPRQGLLLPEKRGPALPPCVSSSCSHRVETEPRGALEQTQGQPRKLKPIKPQVLQVAPKPNPKAVCTTELIQSPRPQTLAKWEGKKPKPHTAPNPKPQTLIPKPRYRRQRHRREVLVASDCTLEDLRLVESPLTGPRVYVRVLYV